MSLFKKRRNLNIKPRRVDDDDEDDSENYIEGPKIISKPNPPQILGPTETYFGKKEKKKSKEKAPEKKTILSFEDELEGTILI